MGVGVGEEGTSNQLAPVNYHKQVFFDQDKANIGKFVERKKNLSPSANYKYASFVAVCFSFSFFASVLFL